MAEAVPQLAERGHVRRPWCVWLAVGLVVLGAVSNTNYLFNHCPLALSDDEAHYWEWARHLDYGYYSKPPGIAWVIAAMLKIGGALGLTGDGSGAALMPVMRLAAVFFGLLSGLLSLFLTRRMFRDDRAALAVIVLSAAVPMFAVGSLLITIDSPMYLCWAATVYCLWRVVEGGRGATGWMYAAGLVCAVGMLFKPVLIAVPLCVLVAMWADQEIRRAFKTWHAVGALALVLLSQVPVVVWNANHGWVTFRHILTQGGLGQQAGAPAKQPWYAFLARIGEYVGGQAGGMAGLMFLLLIIAVVAAIRKVRATDRPAVGVRRSAWVFLLAFTVPLWGFYFVMNFWKRTEVNWPAASYFSGMILLAGVFTERWNSGDAKMRRDARGWGIATIAWGFLLTAVAMNTHRFYPAIARALEPKKGTPAYFKALIYPGKWDQPTVRLRGQQDRAALVEKAREEILAETGMEPLIVTPRYDTSSSLAFYMPGHPFVFSLMSSVGGRMNQYDLWPGLNQLDASGKLAFAGRPAILVNFDQNDVDALLAKAFERISPPETDRITFEGVELKELVIYRAYGFKGLLTVTTSATY